MRQWLKNLRGDKGETQMFVANVLGVRQEEYSRIENGIRYEDLPLSIAAKISDHFEIPLSTIRNYEEELAALAESEVK